MIFELDLIIFGGGVSVDSGKFFKYLKMYVLVVFVWVKNEVGIVGVVFWVVDVDLYMCVFIE